MIIRRHFVLVLTLAAATFAAPARAAPDQPAQEARLPWQVDSERQGSRYSGKVMAVLDFPFRQVADALRSGHNWCEIAPLHFNIKACTYDEGTAQLTFYTGRKHYQAPDKARAFVFRYEVRTDAKDKFEAWLVPDAGTRRSGSDTLVLQLAQNGGGHTHVQALFAYRDTWLTRVAAESYFATLGQNKKGFSVTGTDGEGRPVYADGLAGALERNAARYYFALSAFLGTRDTPAAERFEQRLARWFDLTDRYRAQLFEMEKDAYIGQKRRERSEQVRLQRLLDLRLTSGKAGNAG